MKKEQTVLSAKADPIRDRIIGMLRDNAGTYVSGEKMAHELGLTRAALWKHIRAIREKGYVVDSATRKGYCLIAATEKFTNENILHSLETSLLGRKDIHILERTSSTNDIACALADKGAEEGTLVIAESQTAGRGRMGRYWDSPPGGGLYFSVILRPNMRPDGLAGLTLAAALAVNNAILGISGLKTGIKWPNDILYDNKKISGILAETRAQIDGTDFVVIGVGINVNTPVSFLPEKSSSIKIFSGKKIDRTILLSRVLSELEKYYSIFKQQGFSAMRKECVKNSVTVGSEITVKMRDNSVSGKAIDINEKGALIVENEKGELLTFYSGDVSISR